MPRCFSAALTWVGLLIACHAGSVNAEEDASGTKVASPLSPLAAAKNDWTFFRGDKFATGQAKSGLSASLELLWKYEVKKGAFSATPIILNDVCYLPDLDGVLHAIQLSDGKAKWTKKTGAFSIAASAAYRDGKLYVGDIDGVFRCFDLAGNEIWKFEPAEGGIEISSSATFYDDNVLYGSQDATLYCLDRISGKLIWKLEVQDQIRCSPTVVNDRCFVAGCDGNLHVVDLKLGKEVAVVPIDAPTGGTPAILGEHVYVGTEGGELLKIDWQQAKVAWRFREKRPREIRTSAALNENIVVIGSRSKNVYGVDAKTGKDIWTFTCRRGVDSSAVIAGDNVVFAASDGRIYLVDLMSGKQRWMKETGDSFAGSPAIVGGRMVIASNDGVVYCFGPKDVVDAQ